MPAFQARTTSTDARLPPSQDKNFITPRLYVTAVSCFNSCALTLKSSASWSCHGCTSPIRLGLMIAWLVINKFVLLMPHILLPIINLTGSKLSNILARSAATVPTYNWPAQTQPSSYSQIRLLKLRYGGSRLAHSANYSLIALILNYRDYPICFLALVCFRCFSALCLIFSFFCFSTSNSKRSFSISRFCISSSIFILSSISFCALFSIWTLRMLENEVIRAEKMPTIVDPTVYKY